MKKSFKRSIALILSVLMLTCNLPFVSFAAENDGIKISSNVSVSDVEIDSGIEFTYYIEIDGQPYNGTAVGSDAETYDVTDGYLTMPYNVSAVISDIPDGAYYSVKRLAYDNDKYALIKETDPQEGEFSNKEYFVTVDGGERQRITSAEYNAATGGEDKTVTLYQDEDGKAYDEDKLTSVKAWDAVQTKNALGNNEYSVEEKEFTYVTDSLEEYDITYSIDKSYNKKSIFNIFSANVTIGIEGYELGADVETSNKPADGNSTTKKTAREAIINNVKTSMIRLAYRVLTENIKTLTGKTAVLDTDVTSMLPDQSMWSDDTETLTYTAKAHGFKEVTEHTYVYESESVSALKDIAFDAVFAPAPTGSFTVDFMLYDGALPVAYDGANFEIRDSNGKLLTPVDEETGLGDYTFEVKNDSYSIPILGSIGFTKYVFSGLKYGTYTIQQTSSEDGFVVDKTAYEFNVAREDGAVTGDKFAKSSFGSYTALTNNTYSFGATFKVFKNNSISISFHKVDQNDEPVAGADFLLIDRDGLIQFVKDLAGAAPDIVGGLDFNSILEQLSGTDWSNIDVGTIIGLILSIATINPSLLPEITIPAILTSTSDETGLVELNNSKNMLNTLGTVLDSGVVSGEQLAQVIESVFGNVIPEEYLPLLTKLAEMSDNINVTTGFKAGSYIMIETSAPFGYDRNSTILTFTLNNDGTAYVSTGVIFPVIVDALNNRFDVDITEFIVTEEQFEQYKEQIGNAFTDFNEYADYVLGNVIDFVGEIFGEDNQVSNVLDNIRNNLDGYYNRYENLADAIGGLVTEVNNAISQDINEDFRYIDTRYFVNIDINIADCKGNAIDNVQYTVTDSQGNEIELNEDGVSVTVPFGDYSIAVTAPEGYSLDDESAVTTVTVNDAKKTYSFDLSYHKPGEPVYDRIEPNCEEGASDIMRVYCSLCEALVSEVITPDKSAPALGHDYKGSVTQGTDGENHTVQCTRCDSTTEVPCTWDEIDSGFPPKVGVPGQEAIYQCTVCGQTKGGSEIPALNPNVTIVSNPLGSTEVQYYKNGVLTTESVPAAEYGTANLNIHADYDTQIVLTATPIDGSSFIGWMVNNAILGGGKNNNPHSATVLADITYEPIFQEDEFSEFTVVFADKYGNVFNTQTVTSGDEIVIPDGPVVAGQTFTGWSLTDEQIHALTSAATIYANYEINADQTYKVTAVGATISTPDSEAQDELDGIIYSALVTVTAPGAKAWKIGDTIVAYGESYTFYLGADVTLTFETESVTETPAVAAVSTTQIGADGNIKASFLATRTMVEGYTYVNAGFIYSTSADTGELTLGNVDRSSIKACYCTTEVEQFALNLGRTSQAGKIYARAFLAYVDQSNSGVTEIVYTDFEPFDYDAL